MKKIFRKLSFSSAFGLTFALISSSGWLAANAQTQTRPQETGNPYPQAFINAYMQDCTAKFVAGEIPPQQAEQLCNCMLNQFQAQYTVDELIILTQEASEDEEAFNSFMEIGAVCAAQLRAS